MRYILYDEIYIYARIYKLTQGVNNLNKIVDDKENELMTMAI